jgi:hypothetical protein
MNISNIYILLAIKNDGLIIISNYYIVGCQIFINCSRNGGQHPSILWMFA